MSRQLKRKEWRRIVEKAGAQLEDVRFTGGGHIKLVCERSGHSFFIITSNTPSDLRTRKNLVSDIRRGVCAVEDGVSPAPR